MKSMSRGVIARCESGLMNFMTREKNYAINYCQWELLKKFLDLIGIARHKFVELLLIIAQCKFQSSHNGFINNLLFFDGTAQLSH